MRKKYINLKFKAEYDERAMRIRRMTGAGIGAAGQCGVVDAITELCLLVFK